MNVLTEPDKTLMRIAATAVQYEQMLLKAAEDYSVAQKEIENLRALIDKQAAELERSIPLPATEPVEAEKVLLT